MAELKTKVNDSSVTKFLDSVENEKKRNDSYKILTIMKELTGEEPKMWGSSIVGFGSYHYKYASGREGDWFITGFSPRKQNLTLYLMAGLDKSSELMNKLGKYKTGKGCLYIKKLEDIDEKVLRRLIRESMKQLKKIYPGN